MSIRCQKLKMIKKSIKKIMHRMRRTCIDAKNANSNFSDLTKFCQKIKSINMRKNQIFSILFVFLDRVFALQNRICNDCIIRSFETILFFFNNCSHSTSNTLFRNCIVRIVFYSFSFSRIYRTIKFQKIIKNRNDWLVVLNQNEITTEISFYHIR